MTPIKRQSDILNALKWRYDLASDYKLSKFLDISACRISDYRNEKRSMPDELVLKCEKLLKLAPGTLLLLLQSRKTKSPAASRIFALYSQY